MAEQEISVDDAERRLRQEYWQTVRDFTADIKDELKTRLEEGEEGESLREWLIEYLHESIDGCCDVIYTYRAQKVLLCSDNAGAYIEEFGAEGATTDGDINWSALAFAALHRDVIEQLDAEGVDVNDPSSDDSREAVGLAIAETEDE